MNSRLHVSIIIRFYLDCKPNYAELSPCELKPPFSPASSLGKVASELATFHCANTLACFCCLPIPSKSKNQGKFSRSVSLKMQDQGKCSAFSFFSLKLNHLVIRLAEQSGIFIRPGFSTCLLFLFLTVFSFSSEIG